MHPSPLRRAAAAFLTGALLCAAPLAASAQPFPDETIHGTVRAWQNEDMLALTDDRGFIDAVSIGEQTTFSDAGGRERLTPGTHVAIKGYNGGHWFDAAHVEIDGRRAVADASVAPAAPAPAPAYQSYPQTYPVPVPVYYPAYPVYYGPAYYPAYAYPRFSLSLGFGWGGGYGRVRIR